MDKEVKNADFQVIMLENEDADSVKKILDMYFSKSKPIGEFTRGLYYRGII